MQRLPARPIALALLAALLSTGGAPAARAEAVESADELLAAVRQSLPSVPVHIVGELQARQEGGKLDRLVRVDVELVAPRGALDATYTLSDAFGANPEQLHVVASSDGQLRYTYAVGDPAQEVAPPALSEPLDGADLSWAELTLAFLWWKDGSITGSESVKGRMCKIVELPVPAAVAGDVERVKIWIDPALSLFMKAEMYDASGRAIRRMEVKSFKRLEEDLWVVKNLQFKHLQTGHYTSLRVRSLRVMEPES